MKTLIFNGCGVCSVRFAGVDAGTKSYRILWFDYHKSNQKNQAGFEYEFTEVPTSKVKRNPAIIIELLEEINADVYAGLSGYGMPVKHFSELTEKDLKLMTLTLEEEQSVGLRELISRITRIDLNFYTIPAIIHLNTVPSYRKIFKIDMGTYDKLCTAFAVCFDYKRCNFRIIIVEVGYGYTSFLAVKDGRVVDGLGGTAFLPSYGSAGCMDAEVAYLIGKFPKKFLRIGIKDVLKNAVDVLAENVVKGVRAIEVSIDKAEKVVLSGRQSPELIDVLRERRLNAELYGKYQIASALGAAMIACAIGKNGTLKEFARKMGIFSASGSVLDYLPDKWKKVIERRLGIN